jgi:hypothetical protein
MQVVDRLLHVHMVEIFLVALRRHVLAREVTHVVLLPRATAQFVQHVALACSFPENNLRGFGELFYFGPFGSIGVYARSVAGCGARLWALGY